MNQIDKSLARVTKKKAKTKVTKMRTERGTLVQTLEKQKRL